jgi:hypothetical protein
MTLVLVYSVDKTDLPTLTKITENVGSLADIRKYRADVETIHVDGTAVQLQRDPGAGAEDEILALWAKDGIVVSADLFLNGPRSVSPSEADHRSQAIRIISSMLE